MSIEEQLNMEANQRKIGWRNNLNNGIFDLGDFGRFIERNRRQSLLEESSTLMEQSDDQIDT